MVSIKSRTYRFSTPWGTLQITIGCEDGNIQIYHAEISKEGTQIQAFVEVLQSAINIINTSQNQEVLRSLMDSWKNINIALPKGQIEPWKAMVQVIEQFKQENSHVD